MTHSTAVWKARPILLGLLSVIVAVASFLSADAPAWAGRRWFKSAKGGYQVGIPNEWYVKEIMGEGIYQAALSREKVEKQGDLYQYGVSVLRVRDWHSMFKFSTNDPSAMALEYATRLAGEDEGKGQSAVIGLPAPLRGVQSSLFRITKHGGTDDCLAMWLVVVPQGTEWFHALWEVPCKERAAHEAEITSMFQGLTVLPKWGK